MLVLSIARQYHTGNSMERYNLFDTEYTFMDYFELIIF